MRTIVTGAGGVLGGAVRRRLAEAGHDVACIDQMTASGEEPRTAWFPCADLADPQLAAGSVKAAAAWLGGLDALVLLVGGFDWKRVEDTAVEDWRRLFAINVETMLSTVQASLPLLADGGAIVAVGAASAQSAAEGMAPYAAAKSGVARLTEALAKELAPRRIRANAVLPQIIDTPRNRADMPAADPNTWTKPEAIADVIGFLVTPAARAINGALIPVTNAA